jgi:hypothetical protein
MRSALLMMFLVSGAAHAALEIEGTEFVLKEQGRTLRSRDLIGSTLDLGNGLSVRIASVQQDVDDPDIWWHRFQVPGENGWQALCEPDGQGLSRGFPIAGSFSADGRYESAPGTLSLTCSSGAQGKCVRFGYAPFKYGADGRPLHDHYSACLRMVRADYCGDGRATTRDGTAIDIYDRVGVQQAESGADFRFEAGWTADGAVCVHHPRIAEHLDLNSLAQQCPHLRDALGETCTEAEAGRRGAILFNRSR